jgi:UDP-N-acetylmuramoylalanine--D-glutamate ligase
MDRYSGMADYGEAKKLIFTHQSAGDWAVLNADHPVVSQWAADAPAGVAWFGLDSEPRAPGVFLTDGELTWYGADGERKNIASSEIIQVPGRHNLSNAACAATCAILAGAPVEAVRAGLASFTGVADRLEYLTTLRGVRFYNDTTSTTPASTQAALGAIEGPVVLIAGGADKGLDFAELAPFVAARALGVVLLNGTATDLMEREFREAGANVLLRFDDFEAAVRAAWDAAPEGGLVLLSPATASFGMFRNEFDRGEKFKAIVASLGTTLG